MRKITQEEFDALPIVSGVKHCPPDTDYSLVRRFVEGCSFGGYEFINRRIASVSSAGTSGSASCWKGRDGVYRFQIGCRFADETETLEAIKHQYGDDSIYHDVVKLLKRIVDKESQPR